MRVCIFCSCSAAADHLQTRAAKDPSVFTITEKALLRQLRHRILKPPIPYDNCASLCFQRTSRGLYNFADGSFAALLQTPEQQIAETGDGAGRWREDNWDTNIATSLLSLTLAPAPHCPTPDTDIAYIGPGRHHRRFCSRAHRASARVWIVSFYKYSTSILKKVTYIINSLTIGQQDKQKRQ